jgi:hypothetical protein
LTNVKQWKKGIEEESEELEKMMVIRHNHRTKDTGYNDGVTYKRRTAAAIVKAARAGNGVLLIWESKTGKIKPSMEKEYDATQAEYDEASE